MARLTVSLLGGFQVRLDSGPAVALPTRKAQALFAYLALPPGQLHPRDKLAALLWGGIREYSARASLRQALFSIRKALGETDALRLEASTVALAPAVVEVDVDVFTRSIADGSPESLVRAAELYRGDLLAGLVVDEPPWEDWLLAERERLRELALEALAKLLAHQRRSGSSEAVVGTALKLLAVDPIQESVHRVLMRLYAELGRRGAALRQYQQCVNALLRELGTEPEAETKRLYEEILRTRPARPPIGEMADPAHAPSEVERTKRRIGGGPVRAVLPTARRSSAFVGRTAEIGRLRDVLAGAIGGHGGVVAVLGEAGVGKSRLLAEVAAGAAALDVVVLTGRAYESEQILPFGPWVDALQAGGLATDAPLLEALGPASRSELARLLPELGEAPRDTGDPRRMFEAVLALLGHVATPAGLLLVLEDLHWADEMSARLLAFVGRRLGTHGVLVIVSVRAEELDETAALGRALDELDREGHLTRLTLSPLSREDSDRLVRALARSGSGEEHLRRLAAHAWAVGGGNPFVIVETVQPTVDGATVTDPGTGSLPERVREVIRRHLARLSEPARALAAVAAVIGREFDFALLRHAAGLDEHVAAGAVEELVRRGVLYGVGERFDFTHDRIRAVVYEGLLPPRRLLWHRRVAEALEAVHTKTFDSEAPAIAWHAARGELWDKAVTYLRRSAALAITRAAYQQAASFLEQALEAHGRLPAGPGRVEEAIDLRLDLRHALWPLDANDRMLVHLRKAEALAQQIGDRGRLGRVAAYRLQLLRAIGDTEAAIATGRDVLRLVDESGELALAARLFLGQTLLAHGDYDEAETVLRMNAARRGEEERYGLPGSPVAFSLASLTTCAAERGEFADAIAVGDAAIALADTIGQPFTTAAVYSRVAMIFLRRGDPARSLDGIERTRALRRPGELYWYTRRADAALGYAYALMGRASEAVPLLETALSEVTGERVTSQAIWLTWFGEVYLALERVADARAVATRAHEIAERHRYLGQLAWIHWLLAEVSLAERASPDIVEGHLARAMSLAEPRRMRPVIAHCRLTRGRLLATRGQRHAASDELRAARAVYEAMEMPYWRARADAQLAGLD